MKLDPETLWFSSIGPANEASHLRYPEPLKGEDLLQKMEDVFKTEDWIRAVNSNYGASRRTAFNWLDRLNDAGLVKLKTYGFHEKIPQQGATHG